MCGPVSGREGPKPGEIPEDLSCHFSARPMDSTMRVCPQLRHPSYDHAANHRDENDELKIGHGIGPNGVGRKAVS